MDRRAFLRGGLVLAGTGLVACSTEPTSGPDLILPTDPRISAAEARRRSTGAVRSYQLSSTVDTIDLGGPKVTTWTYGGRLPGPELRVRAGDTVEAVLRNQLPVDTTIHWHGLALRNDMDGAHMLTQPAVAPDQSFTYRFIAETPGTYWFHPHSGTQLDRGLYAPLIVEDPTEPGDHDHDWIVMLDDWIDGTGSTPDDVLTKLRASAGMHMTRGMGAAGSLGGDVSYPHYLLNGRIPAAPATFTGKPGQRARIRLINAASDTAFRVAIGGHRMRITHTDGFPVQPIDTDALVLGMGERYDVTVTLADGVFPLVALAEAKNATALALIRTGTGTPPPAGIRPAELSREIAGYARLTAAPEARLSTREPAIRHQVDLTGGMMNYNWGINGKPFDPARRFLVGEGQRVRIALRNQTMMWHPMHLHGHTFQLGTAGPRKDTVVVLPGQTLSCDFDAVNPGQWMIHCHNTYHAEAGMATILGYRT